MSTTELNPLDQGWSPITELNRKTIPVAEIFGPTLNGEGALAGRPTYFLRVGGCDFSCLWCDSGHAVNPNEVKGLPRFTQGDINERLGRWADDHPGPDWLTISGGNPGLYDLKHVVEYWQAYPSVSGWGHKVAVETQGSRWQDWFKDVNLLTVSPKPPSSGMATKVHENMFDAFWQMVGEVGEYWAQRTLLGGRIEDRWQAVFKVVVFDEADYQFARALHIHWPLVPFYLSCGTAMGGLSGSWVPPDARHLATVQSINEAIIDTKLSLLERYRWLAERMMGDKVMADVAGFPQLHALTWGIDTKGV